MAYTIRVESTTNCSIVFPWGWRNPRVVFSNQNRIGFGVWPANRLARRILCIWKKWQKANVSAKFVERVWPEWMQKNTKTTNAEIEKIERGNPPKKKPKFVIKEKNIDLILIKKKRIQQTWLFKSNCWKYILLVCKCIKL